MEITVKDLAIQHYLDNGFIEVDVTEIEGVCNAFTGCIDAEKGIQIDTDGSRYVTVTDQEGNAFDVPTDKIDLAPIEQDNGNYLLEHAIVNQLEADLEAQEFDSLSVTIQELLKNPAAKKTLIEYLGDSAKENWLEGRTNVRY